MAVLTITLLGGFEARLAGVDLDDLPGQKEQALLAVLALPPGTSHSRDRLAGLLWSDRGDAQARDSLKHALGGLQALFSRAGVSPIVADRHSVRLDASGITLDVVLFEALLREANPEAAERAVALYRGDLLDGVGVRDPAFEDWLLVERQRLRQRAEEAAAGLLSSLLAAGAQQRAVAVARRLLSLDPLHEEATRALMRMHADRGEAAQALKLCGGLRDRLRQELGVAPEPETASLEAAIRRGPVSPPWSPKGFTAEVAEQPATPPPLPDRPSIAVLAFQNLSADPEQDYFADGIVEEIIAALSHTPWLFVIARNSSFIYKGRAIDVKEVGRALGVRYVLEGSVRRAANRVRIMAHLIDTATGAHLWANSYEGDADAIFDLQDRVTASVVGTIAPRLEQAEIARAMRKPTGSLDAYDCYLRGLAAVHRWTREGNLEADRMFAKAIERDADFAAAYGHAARCCSQRKACGWVTDPAGDIAAVRYLARRAAELGEDDAVALCTAGIALAFVACEPEEGGALIERALDLNPNLAMAWLFSGWVQVWNGAPEVAIDHLAKAIRLSPRDPQVAMMQAATACAHFFAGRTDEAAFWAEASVRRQPNYRIANCVLAANSAIRGDLAQARRIVRHLREIDPELRVSNLLDSFPIRRSEHAALWAEGLRRAGLPE